MNANCESSATASRSITKSTKRLLLVFLLLILSFWVYFFSFFYPIADSFDFWHVAAVVEIEETGGVRADDSNSGFYAYTAMVAAIGNVSLEHIFLMPLQSASFLLLFLLLLRNSSQSLSSTIPYVTALGLIFVTKFGNKSMFIWGTHELGLLLFILVASLLLIRCRDNHRRSSLSGSVPMVLVMLSVVSLNFVSYKVVFLTIVFLIVVHVMEWHARFVGRGSAMIGGGSLKNVILFSLVFTFSYNAFLYNIALEKILYPRSSFGLTGIEKLTSSLGPLSDYAFRSPVGIEGLNVAWALVALLSLTVFGIANLHRIAIGARIPKGELLLFGMAVAGLPVLVLYTYLGLFDINYLVFFGICSMAVLARSFGKKTRQAARALILCLILVGVVQNIVGLRSDYYDGLSDENEFEYVWIPSEWCVGEFSDQNRTCVGDIFSVGFIATVISTHGSDYLRVRPFSESDILFIIEQNATIGLDGLHDDIFILNNRLNHFSMRGWVSISSWVTFEHAKSANTGLNSIYSSGDIEICVRAC